MELTPAADRLHEIVRTTRAELESTALRGHKGGSPRVVDEDKRRAILARRDEGQSLRGIARSVGFSLAVVHGEVRAPKIDNPNTAHDPTAGVAL